MNQSILDRYSRTEDNNLVIDITTEKVEDLYDNFDRNAPYIKKDLDADLTDYLVNAVREIGQENFVIRFRFTASPDPDLIARVSTSIRNYFQYMQELENQDIARMMRKSTIFLLTGIAILILSIVINGEFAQQSSVIFQVVSQGLTIAAWVSLWEALANFLIHWTPHQRLKKIYARIADAPLLFN